MLVNAGDPAGAEGQAAMPRRRWGWLTAVGVVLVVLGGLLGWAVRTLLAPPASLPAGRPFSVVTVEEGTVQRSFNLNVQAAWAGGPAVINSSSGVLTEVKVSSGETVSSGQVAYTVDLSPVVFGTGKVPAFRDLEVGVKGLDVAQLQGMLRAAGVRSAEPDGDFGVGTAGEVKAWQRALGVPQTGSVSLGQVVFVPALPGVLAWEEEAKVGARLSPGTAVGRILPGEPVFTMSLPTNQRALVEPGMAVLIRAGESEWKAQLGRIGEPTQEGTATAALVPADGGSSICGADCSRVPITGDAGLLARVVVVPAQEGPIVPVAALAVSSDGSSAVVTEDGRDLPVSVVAAAGGKALVKGVNVGTKVRVPAAGSAPRVGS